MSTALGIDIGSHSVKAVLLRRRGSRIQLLRAVAAPLEELGHMEDSRRKTSKIAMIVRNLLKSAGIRPQPARIAVAGRKSIIRYTRVPPAPAWRLKMLVDYEIEGDTENGGKDLAYDFRLLELPTAHLEFTVLIAMARNDLVEGQCELMTEAGVVTEDITLTPFPLFNTFAQNRGATLADDKTYLLVDIGADNLNVVVQRNGKLLFARNIAPAGRAFTEAVQDEFRLPLEEAENLKCTKGRLLVGGDTSSDETQASPAADAPTEISGEELPVLMADEPGPTLSPTEADQVPQLSEAMLPVVGRLASAIQSSLMYCRAQTRMPDLEVDTMVLTGGGARLPGLRHELARRLGIAVVPADTLKGFDLSPMPREMRERFEADAESYATAIGLALPRLVPEAVQLSLLPEKLKNRRRFLAQTVYLWLAGAAMLLILALLGYSSWANSGKVERYADEAEAKLGSDLEAKGKMDTLLRINGQYAAEVGAMQDIFLSPRQKMAAFAALTRHVPPEVELTRFVAAPPKPGGDANEVLIEGRVLRKVGPRGQERVLQKGDAQAIVRKLSDDLAADAVFDPPPAPEPVLQREAHPPAGNSVEEFLFKLIIAKVQNESLVGAE